MKLFETKSNYVRKSELIKLARLGEDATCFAYVKAKNSIYTAAKANGITKTDRDLLLAPHAVYHSADYADAEKSEEAKTKVDAFIQAYCETYKTVHEKNTTSNIDDVQLEKEARHFYHEMIKLSNGNLIGMQFQKALRANPFKDAWVIPDNHSMNLLKVPASVVLCLPFIGLAVMGLLFASICSAVALSALVTLSPVILPFLLTMTAVAVVCGVTSLILNGLGISDYGFYHTKLPNDPHLRVSSLASSDAATSDAAIADIALEEQEYKEVGAHGEPMGVALFRVLSM